MKKTRIAFMRHCESDFTKQWALRRKTAEFKENETKLSFIEKEISFNKFAMQKEFRDALLTQDGCKMADKCLENIENSQVIKF